ncbi:MAG: response regulator transcription factor [Alphaproteobacteria bacterium]|nr:response regulator transcription factor [Alphaproteobacteria bacterium]
MTTAQAANVTAFANTNSAPSQDEAAGHSRPGFVANLVLVDDDPDYREAVSGELTEHGFNVVGFDDGPPALEYFAAGHGADVVVLDWRLRTMTGLDVLTQLRRRGVMLPVVFLTGLPALDYESEALDNGALDFVDKARGAEILAKRVKLIVEAGKQPPALVREEKIVCGPLVLRPRISRAYWGDTDVNLTVTEYNIVHRLIEQAGDYVSYRAIYDCVHRAGFIAGSGDEGFRTNVRSSMKRIRNKFRTIDAGFTEIENYPAFGYRWRSAATAVR